MRLVKAALGLAVALGSLLLGGAAAFGGTPSGGAIQVWGTPKNNGGGSVVITGVIADSGKSEGVTSAGKPTKNANYTLLKLKKGTILVSIKQLNAATNSASPTVFNTATCSGAVMASAPVTLVRGTKAYAGITGTVTITITFAVVLPLTKGKCNVNTSASPTSMFTSLTGTGTVSF